MLRMMISQEELEALLGLSHLQRLIYLQGLRPYVDYETGLVGLKRGISYQSLAEILFVEPHPGIQSGSPSKDQIRRALKRLEQAKLIEIQSQQKKLILKCSLLNSHQFAQNKAASKSHHQAAHDTSQNSPYPASHDEASSTKAALAESTKAATPLIESNNNYFFYLGDQFEKFWQLYPNKCGKQQAWEAFKALSPTEDLCNLLLQALQQQCDVHRQQKAQGQWVPNWCNPANWLSKRRFEDEVNLNPDKETRDETRQSIVNRRKVRDPFWQPCKEGYEEERTSNNVISFKRYREGDVG